MATMKWTPAAEDDLEQIFLYLGREKQSLNAAEKVVRDIVSKAWTYADEPLLAAIRPEFGISVRSFHIHR